MHLTSSSFWIAYTWKKTCKKEKKLFFLFLCIHYSLVKDPNNHVKDTTAWTLGRMFEFLHSSVVGTSIINEGNCQQIITVLLQSMKDVPNVAEKACGALYFLAQGYEDVGPTSPLTPFFQEIVQSLLTVTHREDATESRLRTAAYETLNEVVRCSTDETATLVVQLVSE